MRSKARLFLPLAALFALTRPLPARAEIDLVSVQWQLVRREPGKALKPPTAENLSALSLAPGGKLSGRLKAKLKLLNRGPEIEAVLLRYAVSAKIAPLDGRQAAAWALAFMLSDH